MDSAPDSFATDFSEEIDSILAEAAQPGIAVDPVFSQVVAHLNRLEAHLAESHQLLIEQTNALRAMVCPRSAFSVLY